MKPQPFYQVDAFTNKIFRGNPAAVCPLAEWLPDDMLPALTIEHNQSETAFFVPGANDFELRWFTTSQGEIDLCGHATLASAHVIFAHLLYPADEIHFRTRFSGSLYVRRDGGWLTLDFPSWRPEPAVLPEWAVAGLENNSPRECLAKRDYLLVFDDPELVRRIKPDFSLLRKVDRRICITAPGDDCDFVSRFFCAGDALEEDPVTGSAHSMLIPYWAQRLKRTSLTAKQISARGGDLRCELKGDRVLISGQAVTYMTGTIYLP